MYSHEIQEEIDSTVAYLKESMPKEIRKLISKANNDLYSGPSYYDADGDECTMWDDGAIPFDFSKACAEIRDYLDFVSDVKIFETVLPDDDDGESALEFDDCFVEVSIDGSADQIKLALVGRELYSYVR